MAEAGKLDQGLSSQRASFGERYARARALAAAVAPSNEQQHLTFAVALALEHHTLRSHRHDREKGTNHAQPCNRC